MRKIHEVRTFGTPLNVKHSPQLHPTKTFDSSSFWNVSVSLLIKSSIPFQPNKYFFYGCPLGSYISRSKHTWICSGICPSLEILCDVRDCIISALIVDCRTWFSTLLYSPCKKIIEHEIWPKVQNADVIKKKHRTKSYDRYDAWTVIIAAHIRRRNFSPNNTSSSR